MRGIHLGTLCLAALFTGLAGLPVRAEEEPYVCGTMDAPADPLAKSAALPKINKVWTGKLKALVIRVGLSDAPYTLDTPSIGRTNESINTLYRAMSRNTFEWDWRIHPTVLSAPGTRATYGSNFTSLQSWITQQISAAGLRRGTDYDVYIAHFPQIGVTWAGLSNLRDANWINGSYSAGVTAHELGHSLSLQHAHSIEAGTDMFGTPGTTSQTNEYGNPYDVMGRGGLNGHFNMMYKWRVGWADADEVQEVSNSGVYRIYAQDNAVHKSRTIGIKVPTGNPSYSYWFEYRTISTNARNGASVSFQGFQGTSNMNSWFLDATPGSRTSNDETDGILAVGKQFKDKYGESTFRTVAINSGTWTAEGWVDIEVVIPGTVPTRIAPLHPIRPGPGGISGRLFDMNGRAIAGGASPARELSVLNLAVRETGGPARLVLNAR